MALALFAAAGTLIRPEDLRSWVGALPPIPLAGARWLALDDWYRSVPFRGLGALLLFQLLFCSLQRAARGIAGLASGRSLPGRLPTVARPMDNPQSVRERLLARGYRPMGGGGERFTRFAWWSLRGVVVHLSIATVIVGGAVAGLFGAVGTTWAPEGEKIAEMTVWPDDRPAPLPFSLMVARITERYPLTVRLGLAWKETGAKEPPVELQSGASAPLPGTSLSAEILRVSRDLRSADILLREGEREVAIVRAGPDRPVSPLPFDLFVVATRGRREPEWFGVTGLLNEGNGERKVHFGVNDPLTVAGHTVSLTAYRGGEGGEPWVAGLQITSAPGLGVAALGALLLTGALLAYLVPVREARVLGDGPGHSRLLLRGLAPPSRLEAEAGAIVSGGDS